MTRQSLRCNANFNGAGRRVGMLRCHKANSRPGPLALNAGFMHRGDLKKPQQYETYRLCIAWLFGCGVLLLFMTIGSSAAMASCATDPANNGDTVTCSGSDGNGFNSA